jgi:hypothetical protein
MPIERVYIPSNEQSNALAAAADPACTREDMAGCYAELIRCAQIHGAESIDFAAVNRAILARWPAGLVWIKRRAWKLVEED